MNLIPMIECYCDEFGRQWQVVFLDFPPAVEGIGEKRTLWSIWLEVGSQLELVYQSRSINYTAAERQVRRRLKDLTAQPPSAEHRYREATSRINLITSCVRELKAA